MGAAALNTLIWILDGPIIFRSEPALFDLGSGMSLVSFRLGQVAGLSLVLWGLRTKSERAHSVIAWTTLVMTGLTAWSRFFPDAFSSGL